MKFNVHRWTPASWEKKQKKLGQYPGLILHQKLTCRFGLQLFCPMKKHVMIPWSNFRIPRNSFTCHWIRIASIVLCLDLQSLPTHVSEADQSCGVFWSLADPFITVVSSERLIIQKQANIPRRCVKSLGKWILEIMIPRTYRSRAFTFRNLSYWTSLRTFHFFREVDGPIMEGNNFLESYLSISSPPSWTNTRFSTAYVLISGRSPLI